MLAGLGLLRYREDTMTIPDRLAFVDIETTGMSPGRDRIIEIGIVRVEAGQVTQKYQTLINPHVHVSPFIEAMTGINAAELVSAPSFEEIAKTVEEILAECLFVAHNVRFDYSFIKLELGRLGISLRAPKLCTVKLSRTLFPHHKKHNLDSIMEHHGLTCEARHRALGDAEVIWQFFDKVTRETPPEVLTQCLDVCLKRASFPTKIALDRLESIPDSPGIYLFYGKNGLPIYIGKSVNLHDRVLSHFVQNDNPTDMKIARECEDFEIIETAGELGALLLEAEYIKKLQPVYNRALRRVRELTALIKTETNGYITPMITKVKTLAPEDINIVLGLFRSKRQADGFLQTIAKEYQLCPKLLGLEKTKGRCMYSQFEWCKGACVGQEAAHEYNIRLMEAFEHTRIAPWPFDDAITITEASPDGEKQEHFIVNNWCYVRSSETHSPMFDLDMYKILRRYLRKKKNWKMVKQYSALSLQAGDQHQTAL